MAAFATVLLLSALGINALPLQEDAGASADHGVFNDELLSHNAPLECSRV